MVGKFDNLFSRFIYVDCWLQVKVENKTAKPKKPINFTRFGYYRKKSIQ